MDRDRTSGRAQELALELAPQDQAVPQNPRSPSEEACFMIDAVCV